MSSLPTAEEEVQLTAGDVLYLPSHTTHDVRNGAGVSLHVTFGLEHAGVTWAALLEALAFRVVFGRRCERGRSTLAPRLVELQATVPDLGAVLPRPATQAMGTHPGTPGTRDRDQGPPGKTFTWPRPV